MSTAKFRRCHDVTKAWEGGWSDAFVVADEREFLADTFPGRRNILGRRRTAREADAWATVLMVLGPDKGATLARQSGLDALFLLRDDDASARGVGVGRLFSEEPAAIASAERR